MKIKRDLSPLIRSFFILLIMISATGCATSRTVVMKSVQSDSKSYFQLPVSVRVELKEIKQEDPNPVTPIFIDRNSLKTMIVTYLQTRNVFQSVNDVDPDSILDIDIKYYLDTSYFKYTVDMKATLVTKEGMELNKYSAQGFAQGGATRFSADSDAKPMNNAMKNAIENLCQQMENSRQLILTRLKRPATIALAEKSPAKSDAKSDIDDLPDTKIKSNKNAYAIVIGIEQYRQKLPKADFAASDANLVSEYLIKVMGYPEENVITLINDRALKSDLEKYFDRWLSNNVEENSRVFIYYSGHGAPDTKTGDAYLVPYDGDPTFIAETGYSLTRLYNSLGKLKVKEITVALDSCFSGAGGRSVLAKGAKPLVMTINTPNIQRDITVLTASAGNQISSAYEDKGHGLFTYFLLKGIKNEDVINPDGSIEITGLYNYIKPQVERIARKQYNNEQTPQLIEAKKK